MRAMRHTGDNLFRLRQISVDGPQAMVDETYIHYIAIALPHLCLPRFAKAQRMQLGVC